MKYLLTVVFSILLFVTSAYSQQEKDSLNVGKDNPIVFAEVIMGIAGGSASGPTVGMTANYQEAKSLYTFRYIYQYELKSAYAAFSFVGFPFFINKRHVNEFSLLYGRRTIKDGRSYSFSGGISFNSVIYNKSQNNAAYLDDTTFVGFPFEVNIKWFKKEKKRFRAYYGLIPIGKPTSFGRSLGFKLYGNFGKLSYVGIGINYGFGWHKRY